ILRSARICTHRADRLSALDAARGADDARSHTHRYLYGRTPHSSGGSRYEEGLTRSETRLATDRVMCREECLWDGCRLAVIEVRRDWRDLAFRDEHSVSESASSNDPHHAVSDVEAHDAIPGRDDAPRDLQARHVHRCSR